MVEWLAHSPRDLEAPGSTPGVRRTHTVPRDMARERSERPPEDIATHRRGRTVERRRGAECIGGWIGIEGTSSLSAAPERDPGWKKIVILYV